MQTSIIVALLVLGAVLVVGSLLLRVSSGGKYEIKTIDLVFLIIPLLIVALATGRLKGLDMFGVKADLSDLWTAAAKTKIEGQVASLPPMSVQDAVQSVEMASKGGMQELQHIIRSRTEALEFRLGNGGYYAPAIRTYFDALSGGTYLRYIVIERADGSLFGIYDAATLIGFMKVAGDQAYQQFQDLLNSGDESAQAELARLPGFVAAENAVTAAMSKRDALARMEQLHADSLPVVDQQRHFVGTVERSKLTSSLILAVTDKLEGR
jgi:hypothetical protein